MTLETILNKFAHRDQMDDILKANWYTAASAALAAASAGPDVPKVYGIATQGLSLERQKVVQRRLKEAILKTSPLYGVPRSLQALLPLFAVLKDEEIDHVGPRWANVDAVEMAAAQKARGRKYFDTLWTPAAAQANRDRIFKFQPDLYLLNQEMIYERYISEDSILGDVETQICNVAALICSNCPVQATWHTRGIVRLGGTLQQARFAVDLGLAIADLYSCKTGDVVAVDNIDFNDARPH